MIDLDPGGLVLVALGLVVSLVLGGVAGFGVYDYLVVRSTGWKPGLDEE